jgi:putative intracellular protease/amidase
MVTVVTTQFATATYLQLVVDFEGRLTLLDSAGNSARHCRTSSLVAGSAGHELSPCHSVNLVAELIVAAAADLMVTPGGFTEYRRRHHR